MLTDSTGKLK